MAAPDIDKSSSVPLDRTVCIADKELAGREGGGSLGDDPPIFGANGETETDNRCEQLDQFANRSEVTSLRANAGQAQQ